MAKTRYEELCADITKKVKEKKSTRQSSSDLVDLTQTLLNTPEQKFSIYNKNDSSKKPAAVRVVEPVKRYRESIAGIATKYFGVDKNEAAKLADEVQFTKKDATAVMDVSTHVIKDYTRTGRKLIFPITSLDESQMEITQVEVPDKIIDIAKITPDANGVYTRELTGEKKKTDAHYSMKASNKIPFWMQTNL